MESRVSFGHSRDIEVIATYMFPEHVDALRLQELEVVLHSLAVRWCHESIRPPTLILFRIRSVVASTVGRSAATHKWTKLENKLAVDKRPRDALHLANRDCAETATSRFVRSPLLQSQHMISNSRIALDLVVAHGESEVVQIRAAW